MWKNSILAAVVVLCFVVIAGCAGGGGGAGVSSGESNASQGQHPPTIYQLAFSPPLVPLNSNGGTVQILGTLSFVDAGSDISGMTISAYDEQGSLLGTSTGPLSGSSHSSGVIYWHINADTTKEGHFSIRVFVTDSDGSQSNILTAPFTVSSVWTIKTAMPSVMWDGVAAASDGKLYMVGGETSSGVPAPAIQYDPPGDTWSTKSSMSAPRKGLAAKAIGSKVYVIGGVWAGAVSTLEEYDTITDTWTTKTPMPTPRAWLAASVLDGQLYVVGGADGVNTFSVLEVYDPVSGTWSSRASMSTARSGLASGIIEGKLYVVGGWTQSRTVLGTLEVYDPVADTWTTKASMPTPRYALTVSVVGNKLYAIGGSNNTNGCGGLTTVEEYDPATNLWTTKTSMPTGRSWSSSDVIDNLIYVIGGESCSASASYDNEVYNPAKE